MPKAINIYDKKTGEFKGIEYVVKNGDGSSINLRNFSTSNFIDGIKPKWTMDFPISVKNNGNFDYREIKFE